MTFTITATETKDAAMSLSIGRGGFVYEYCGGFFWVPTQAIGVAEDAGMTLVID